MTNHCQLRPPSIFHCLSPSAATYNTASGFVPRHRRRRCQVEQPAVPRHNPAVHLILHDVNGILRIIKIQQSTGTARGYINVCWRRTRLFPRGNGRLVFHKMFWRGEELSGWGYVRKHGEPAQSNKLGYKIELNWIAMYNYCFNVFWYCALLCCVPSR